MFFNDSTSWEIDFIGFLVGAALAAFFFLNRKTFARRLYLRLRDKPRYRPGASRAWGDPIPSESVYRRNFIVVSAIWTLLGLASLASSILKISGIIG